jgi:hypothetical protein
LCTHCWWESEMVQLPPLREGGGGCISKTIFK